MNTIKKFIHYYEMCIRDRYKSFTKAARALHNNQPNITRCMNNLEQELKCTLFLRSNKGIALTPEGRQLYEHVALAFEQLSLIHI